MTYTLLDYIKRMMSITGMKNVIRFPVERTIKEDDPKTKASKRKLWKVLSKPQETEVEQASILRMPMKETTQEEWLKGYRKWKKEQDAFLKKGKKKK